MNGLFQSISNNTKSIRNVQLDQKVNQEKSQERVYGFRKGRHVHKIIKLDSVIKRRGHLFLC